MSVSGTAQLLVELNLAGNFTSGIGAAESRLSTFGAVAATSGTRAGVLSGAFASAGVAAGKFGGALSHAGSQLKGLISGPLGMIGLTGGLLSFGGAISSTLSKLNDLAFGTERLAAITGDSAASLSTLIASTEKYGISVDKLAVIAAFYEKTAGKLNETSAKGVVIGKSAELLNLELIKNERIAAGLSTKKIDGLIKEQKARDAVTASETLASAGISKLVALQEQYGVTLVDGQGRAVSFNTALLNVADAYATATDKANAAALASTLFGKSWQLLAPVLILGKQGIIDLETEAAKMGLQLSESNVAEFAKYREAIRNSQEAVSGLEVAIGLDLLPTIVDLAHGLQAFVTDHKSDIVTFFHNAITAAKTAGRVIGDLVGTISSFWNSIPPGFRDLLTKGLIADRTIKFLFGFSPLSAAGGLLGTGFGQFFARGSSPLNPMFVSGGAGGLPLAAGGLGGLLTVALTVGTIAAIGAAFIFAINQHPDPSSLSPGGSGPGRGAAFGPPGSHGRGWTPSDGQWPTTSGPDEAPWRRENIAALFANTAALRATPEWLKKWEASTFHHGIQKGIASAEASLLAGINVRGSAALLGAEVGAHGVGAGGAPMARRIIGELQAALGLTSDPATRRAIVAAIERLTGRLPRLEQNARNLHLAEQIASSGETQKQKLTDLAKIMADVKAHGDRTTQTRLQTLIDAVKHQKPPIVNVSVSTSVSVADINRQLTIHRVFRTGTARIDY